MTGELKNVAWLALERLASRGYDYTSRKIYTLAEFDWGSTYGYEGGHSKPRKHGALSTPAGVYIIEGSPCRGVLVIRWTWQGWLVNFVNDHIRRKFIISGEGGESHG